MNIKRDKLYLLKPNFEDPVHIQVDDFTAGIVL